MGRILRKEWYECKKCGYAIDWFDMARSNPSKTLNLIRISELCLECNSAKAREWYSTNKKRVRNSYKKYIKKNPLKRDAWNKVYTAIRNGSLKKKPCEICGETGAHAHHEDYRKPLDVKWLCALHHKDIHRKNLQTKLRVI